MKGPQKRGKRWLFTHSVTRPVICMIILTTALASFAITPSTVLLIAGAARTNRWTADLYIDNPGSTTASVGVM